MGITETPDAWEVQEAAWSETEYQRVHNVVQMNGEADDIFR